MGCCFCEEYSNALNNQYYNILGQKIGITSRIIEETKNWYAVPTIGCLTIGYVLLVCKKHYQSLANLDGELFAEMVGLKSRIERILYRQLKVPCLAFEHGTTQSGYVGANSVEHVHLHIVPYKTSVWHDFCDRYKLDGFERITGYETLFERWQNNLPKSYLFFQDVDSTLYYQPDAANIQSQFFRKCLSEQMGMEQWDWKKRSYQRNFVKTIKLFQSAEKC